MSTASSWRAYPQVYRLEAARCTGCRKTFFPPRQVCNACGAREFEAVTLARTGEVVTHTIIRTPDDRFSGEAPFAVGIVQVDDGPRLTTQIVDVPLEEIAIGMRVKLEFRRLFSDGHSGVIEYGHKAVPLRE